MLVEAVLVEAVTGSRGASERLPHSTISSPTQEGRAKLGPVLTGPGAVVMRSGSTGCPLDCRIS
jgi:hypothetical protein